MRKEEKEKRKKKVRSIGVFVKFKYSILTLFERSLEKEEEAICTRLLLGIKRVC